MPQQQRKKEEMVEKTWGSGGLIGNRALGSLVLILLCPGFALTFWYTCYSLDGSFTKLFEVLFASASTADPVSFLTSPLNYIWSMWPTPFDPVAWKIILGYMAFELFLMRFVPGKEFRATVTPSGHVPIYTENGIASYVITVATLIIGGIYGYLTPAVVYDKMGELLSSMNLFALVLCLFLAFKGIYFPSTKDSGSNNNLIVDYFWGTELYPRILGWDVKQFTNCRFGMMFWQVGIICYAFKQYELEGFVTKSILASIIIQSCYIFKFFAWETGYFCTMDIQHDRAGYYICWGCLVWVPSMYTIHTYFLVTHPVHISGYTFLFITAAGVLSTWCNYDCDRQRQEFRATSGRVKIWGRDPEYIEASYVTADGEKRTSLLLASGWWGLARHFHYIPEIVASFCWCLPSLFTHPLPYFYPVYLTILLVDRAWRDDARCAAKYKEDWVKYCKKVPSKIIPGII